MSERVAQIARLLEACTAEEKQAVFALLRKQIPIHSFEQVLNTQAEVILEAISRSGDLTIRGVRGIIAQATFIVDIIGNLPEWRDVTQGDSRSYDFLLTDGRGDVRVQVKMQRKEHGQPKLYKRTALSVVEVQRTRSGKDRAGESTRPYKFGEFDILAVSLQPSTTRWTDFMYTVGRWLLPRATDASLMEIMQPVAAHPNGEWTDDFLTCVAWFRSGIDKTISTADLPPLP